VANHVGLRLKETMIPATHRVRLLGPGTDGPEFRIFPRYSAQNHTLALFFVNLMHCPYCPFPASGCADLQNGS